MNSSVSVLPSHLALLQPLYERYCPVSVTGIDHESRSGIENHPLTHKMPAFGVGDNKHGKLGTGGDEFVMQPDEIPQMAMFVSLKAQL